HGDQCRTGLDLGKCNAAGRVDEEAIPGVADTTANGGLPVILDFERVAREQEGFEPGRSHEGSFQARPVEVAFDTEHPAAGLPLATELAAEHPPVAAAFADARQR